MSVYKGLLDPLVASILARQDGLTMPGYPLRTALRGSQDELVQYLIEQVEAQSDGKWTLLIPQEGLIFGYLQGVGVDVVLCHADTALPIRREQVVKSWILTGGGLLPTAFDDEPEEAEAYFLTMNGY